MKRLLFLFAVVLLAFSPVAKADPVIDTTFTFTGNCTDCSGTGTGTLVVRDYTPGVEMTNNNFVSFSYSSNLASFDLTSSDTNFKFDATLSSVTGPYSVTISNGNSAFESSVNGSWSLTGYVNTVNKSSPVPPPILEDYGSTSSWSTGGAVTPEPGTFSLLGTGIAVIAAMRSRWKLKTV